MRAIAFSLAFSVAALACSSSSGGGGSVSADTACSDYAAAICGKANSCSPTLLASVWGDVTQCTTRFKQLCADALAAPSTGVTADFAESCSKAMANAGCDALFDRNTP